MNHLIILLFDFVEVDLIFNPKDFPELKEDDIVEICTVEDKRR